MRKGVFVFILFLIVFIHGCATRQLIETNGPKRLFIVSSVKILDNETEPYLKNFLKARLEEVLLDKGLLYKEGAEGELFRIDVTILANYPPFVQKAKMSWYQSLESTVSLMGPGDRIIKEGHIITYNGWGPVTAQFTELQHARDIVEFLLGKN